MNWKVLTWMLFAGLLCGTVHAQMGGDDGGVADEVAYYLETYDHNSDGKITLDEIKKSAADDAEGGTEMEKLDSYGDLLTEFLSADSNDDQSVGKDELTAYFTLVFAGKKTKLSAKDWDKLVKDYIEPLFKLNLKQYDKDGDKAISRAEAKAIEDLEEEGFGQFDTDKDGKISAGEFKTTFKKVLGENYQMPKGGADVKDDGLTPEQLKNLQAAFGQYDANKDGKVTKQEYKESGGKDEYIARWWGRYIAYLAMDTDDNLEVSFDEYKAFAIASANEQKYTVYPVDEKEACNEIWSTLDDDKDGSVSDAEYKKALGEDQNINGVDVDGDGKVTKTEMWTYLKRGLKKTFQFADKDKPKAGGGDSGDFMSDYDKNGDGKVDIEEVRAHALKDAAPDASERDKLIRFKMPLARFLPMDLNGDDFVTADEYAAYHDNLKKNDGPARFSRKNWQQLNTHFIDPYLALSLKLADKDGDKALSKDEALTLSDLNADKFANMDLDGDGKLTAAEYRFVVKGYLRKAYDFEESPSDVDPAEVPPSLAAQFKATDTDSDGSLSFDEVKTANTKERSDKPFIWGLYISFLAMDRTDDLKVSLGEYFLFTVNEVNHHKHDLYPADRKAELKLIWGDLDADKDGKVTEAEYTKLIGQNNDFKELDTDKDGQLSRDEVWAMLKGELGKGFRFHDTDKTGSTTTPPGDEGNKGADESADPFALYKKKGRSWKLKEEVAGMTLYVKYEVVKVADDQATVRVSTLDAQGNLFPGAKPRDTTVKFDSAARSKGPEGVTVVEKEITVEAGTFKCFGVKFGDKKEPEIWMMKKYPRLLVKSTQSGVKMELVEFNE